MRLVAVALGESRIGDEIRKEREKFVGRGGGRGGREKGAGGLGESTGEKSCCFQLTNAF